MESEVRSPAPTSTPPALVRTRKVMASQLDIYFLGLTLVIGGQIIYWSQGFQEGFWQFFISVIIVGSGYLCLTLCLAEMTSMMPFAGGSFGYVRCALGPMIGYMVGCCESIEYILYVASSLVELGRLISTITSLPITYEPLYWMCFYCISLAIQVNGGRNFWFFNACIAIVTVLLILIYCLGSLPYVDFQGYAMLDGEFNGGVKSGMYFFPLVSWFYVGIEGMTLSCDDIKEANRRVPIAMIWTMLTLLLTSLCILLCAASQAPGPYLLSFSTLPLNAGYSQALNITSPRILALFALPGIFSTAFGFMFAYGRQMYAMSRSGLLPDYLSHVYLTADDKTPVTALLTGSILGALTLLFIFYLLPAFANKLFNICMLGSCHVYIALFVSYLMCQRRYLSVPRLFINPLGSLSAYYGIAVFTCMAIALMFFQQDNYISLIVFYSFLILAYFYYAVVAQKREFFSEEEQGKFMIAYLISAQQSNNPSKRKLLRRTFKNKQAFLHRVQPYHPSLMASDPSAAPFTAQQQLTLTAPSAVDGQLTGTGAAGSSALPGLPLANPATISTEQQLQERLYLNNLRKRSLVHRW